MRTEAADTGYASDANLKKVEKSCWQFFIAVKQDSIQASEPKGPRRSRRSRPRVCHRSEDEAPLEDEGGQGSLPKTGAGRRARVREA
jgi:hypothetical protein